MFEYVMCCLIVGVLAQIMRIPWESSYIRAFEEDLWEEDLSFEKSLSK